ncbi:hypothetical protein M409DRAFT_26239 [Zasmidium cellare ATCC 36951]|uniref:BHLH domain-containing protein n=1 Tax=Zasmidium cellare ATCC 36951 TaxID=1080233 RepID=A0A6A6CCI7_ZASCE|nr:uncharacterized protein M409DRAFT_26239 [Zasmidium cellare ATCC 36951]KAF2163632.1 hypothetical protein M409DRAFT_26239 [Zasmidium cellare ATCC 36951]
MYLHTEIDSATKTATAKPKIEKKPRVRPLPPDVNSRNLAIEKRRRQDMNRTFLDLARCLPKLASAKRLTKNMIVTESLHYHQQQRSMCIAAGRELRELLAAHQNLVVELNAMRSQLGIQLGNAPWAPSTALLSLMDVENQVYGEFPDGFGSPGETEGQEPRSTGPQRNIDETLSELPVTLDSVHAEPASAQDGIPIAYHRAGNVASTCDWQNQVSGNSFTSPNVQGNLMAGADWWSFNVSGLDPNLLWEDMSAQALSAEEFDQNAFTSEAKLEPGGGFPPGTASMKFRSPAGKFEWRAERKGWELYDKRDVLLARGKIHGTVNNRPSHLEVFVGGDDTFMDLILASWVAMYRGQDITEEDVHAAKDVLEVLGALGGN